MMTREKLIGTLIACGTDPDREEAHWRADRALLEYINDPEITGAYNHVNGWYA